MLIHEVSRIGRRNTVTHKFIENLLEMGVSLYWHQQRIETLLPSGKRNPATGIMVALLSEMALAETETLRERIVSGLEEAKRKGVKIGHPEGTMIRMPSSFRSIGTLCAYWRRSTQSQHCQNFRKGKFNCPES